MRAARTVGSQSRALPSYVRGAILPLPREVLSRLIECLIDRLDEIDGDPDEEDDDPAECEARDDGCGPIESRGRRVWGTADEDRSI